MFGVRIVLENCDKSFFWEFWRFVSFDVKCKNEDCRFFVRRSVFM